MEYEYKDAFETQCLSCSGIFLVTPVIDISKEQIPPFCTPCRMKSDERLDRRLTKLFGKNYFQIDIYPTGGSQEKEKETAIMTNQTNDATERQLQKMRAATRYRINFAIIPVRENKKPYLASWTEFQERKVTREEMEKWWADYPDANLAIVLHEGYVVLDIDSSELAEKVLKSGIVNLTRVERTVSGGIHIWFFEPTWVTKSKENLRKDNIEADLLTKGAYVIVPPSNGYRLLSDVNTKILEVSDAKAKALELLGVAGTPQANVQLEKAVIETDASTEEAIPPQGIPIGRRNDSLTRYAGWLCGKFKDYDWILKRLAEFNQKLCKPPLERKEVEAIVSSIYARESKKKEFDSSAIKPLPVTEKKYLSLNQLKAMKKADIAWLWEGYLARGFTTLLSGLPKSGKTTLLFELIKAFKTQKTFLSKATKFEGKILIVTEENGQLYLMRLESAGLSESDCLILPASEIPGWSRDKILEQVYLAIEQDSATLVVFDTLGEFWGVSEENDASQVVAALKPIKAVASRYNVALLLIHHLRKVEGEYGKAHRGSGALLGAVDIGLEFHYANNKAPKRREIAARSRFPETPHKLLIELLNGEYKSLGDPSAIERSEVQKRFIESLSETDFETIDEISVRMEPVPSRSLIRDIASECRESKLVDFCGEGVKGKAYKFRKLLPNI